MRRQVEVMRGVGEEAENPDGRRKRVRTLMGSLASGSDVAPPIEIEEIITHGWI